MTTTNVPLCGDVNNGRTCSKPKGHDRPPNPTLHRGQHVTGQAWMAWPPQPAADVDMDEEEPT